MSVCAIIAAAGSGKRMGGDKNKLLIPVGNKKVIERTLERFQETEIIDSIIVVTADEEIRDIAKNYPKVMKIVSGGDTRQKSVYEGILAAEGYDVVAVHDGARCLVSKEIIKNAVKVAEEKGACVPCADIVDTLKEVSNEFICGGVDREKVKAIQTPQCFRRDLLIEAYKNADGSETDESSLVSKIAKVHICPGERKNIKVTTKFDLILAKAILESGEF